MRTFAAGICQPALIMLHGLADLFSYAGSVMEDTFSLLRRYGMQDIMASRLPKNIANALHQPSRIFKPGPAIFLDASEQSALRESPEPTPMATDRGESELFRPPFHSRKDVRIELDPNDSEALTPSSASWTTPSQMHWNDGVIDAQSNASYAHAYGGASAAPMDETLQAPAHGADLSLQSLQAPDSQIAKGDLLPSAITSLTPGIFGSDPAKDRESQFLGDVSRLSCFDPLGQSWPPMYSDGNVEM
ncbi:unnamed protein product [Clonostachys byssicola]|uniref:Uncharacterized protein n=1 Tax=Clonostachys byssicola TaxID=160290 RepID=A0A9N9UP37_9HYPO|nr:unnamed protein product [Clonostachys byssicola]